MIDDYRIELNDTSVFPENKINKYGPIITNLTAWRNAEDIPLQVPTEGWSVEEEKLIDGFIYKYSTNGIIAKIVDLPVQRVNLSQTFFSEELKNLIPPAWDDTTFSYKVKFKNTNTNKEITDGLGNPVIDNSAGTITFDKDFTDRLLDIPYPLTVSFYKYVGIIGFYGSLDEEQFPRLDNLPLIRSALDHTITGRFILADSNTDNFYTLPKTDGSYQEEGTTIIIQQNLQDVLNKSMNIDGGSFMPLSY